MILSWNIRIKKKMKCANQNIRIKKKMKFANQNIIVFDKVEKVHRSELWKGTIDIDILSNGLTFR